MFEDDNTMTYDKVSNIVQYKLGSSSRHEHHVGQTEGARGRQIDCSKMFLRLANLGTLTS